MRGNRCRSLLGNEADAQEIMTSDVVWMTPETPLAEVAAAMSQERFHRVPIVENGKVIGIITSLDLLSEFALATNAGANP